MKVLDGNSRISSTDINRIREDPDLAKMMGHLIESMKQLYPGKFAQAAGSQGSRDIYEAENVIDFQYARLYNLMESDSRFKEYMMALLGDPDYKEMQVDEYFAVVKPLFLAG